MVKCVGAPRAPAFGSAGGSRRRAVGAECPQRVAHADVGGEEHVRVAERPHGHVAGGPGADARERLQRGDGVLPVAAGVERKVTGREPLARVDECPAPGPGHRQRRRVQPGEHRRRGEQVRDVGDRFAQRFPVRGDEAGRIDNHIDVFSKSFLGLTVACARCHDPDRLDTRAEKAGEGWALTGDKTAVIDGFDADAWVVSAMADGAPALFLVEKGGSGLTVERFVAVDSRNYAKLAFSGTPAVRLGQGDAGAAIAAGLDVGRALLAAELLGAADEAFGRTVEYLKERKQFDRIIGTFQGLQHRAARLYSRLDLARGVVLKALRAIDEQDADATWLASLAKGTMTRLSRDVMMEAMQMHGGIGVTDDHDVGLYVKRAQAAGELLGDDHFHTERLAAGKWGL